MNKVPNLALRTIRENVRRQSRDEFARDIVSKGQAIGESVGCDGRLIGRWEDGDVRSPRPVYRRILTALLDRPYEELGFGNLAQRSDAPPAPDEDMFPDTWQESVASAVRFWSGDLEHQPVRDPEFVGAGAAVSVLRWLTSASAESPSATGRTHVGISEVRAIREVTATLRSLDNQLGGGHARLAAVGFLHGAIGPILRDGTYSEDSGRALFSAAAELTHLAGWMAYDIERHGLAQRYLVLSLRLAMAADDTALGGEILAGLSHQSVYLGDTRDGIDQARAAGLTAAKAGLSALAAEAAVMEAHGHARAGDSRACLGALGQADRMFARAGPVDRPQWISYLDEAYLAAKFAHCFSALGQPATAEGYAVRSLDMDDRYVRGRAFNSALLAKIHLQRGAVEQACSVATDALNLTRAISSTRARTYLGELDSQMAQYSTVPAVRVFRTQARGYLPSVT